MLLSADYLSLQQLWCYFPNYIWPNPPCKHLLWEETGVPGENPRLSEERWPTLFTWVGRSECIKRRLETSMYKTIQHVKCMCAVLTGEILKSPIIFHMSNATIQPSNKATNIPEYRVLEIINSNNLLQSTSTNLGPCYTIPDSHRNQTNNKERMEYIIVTSQHP
jgi:hypothetical protein